MEYTVAVSKDPKSKWYIGQCVEVAGALSQGRSLEELMENMKDAIELVVEYKNGSENGKSSMHSIYVNSNNGKFVTIPDHSDINDYLANAICDMLGIPRCCENPDWENSFYRKVEI